MHLSKNGKHTIFFGKTDASSTFRVLPLKRLCFCWMVVKAVDPSDNKMKYFIDKCLPFGASISCALYQKFSDALRFIIEHRSGKKAITNYLDDFLFAAITCWLCNQLMIQFIELCQDINVPIADDKTEWATVCIMFLGILLDGDSFILSIPIDKQRKALNLLNKVTNKCKVTIKQLQILAGYLNFLNTAIAPGRTFTRRIYAKFAGLETTKTGMKLKPHHHVTVDQELRFDCEVWKTFLMNFTACAVCRPMIDLQLTYSAEVLNFYSDASANPRLGFGAIFENRWIWAQWEEFFVSKAKPSIEYLELVGVVAAMLTWGHLLRNKRVIVFCDNSSVVGMINNMTSSCKNCMYLLHLLTLNNIISNRITFARHVLGIHNNLSDALSRLQFDRFWRLALGTMEPQPWNISPLVWPISKIWQDR